MKITKAEGYKKPNYAVALAAAMVAVTVSGCGSQNDGSGSIDLEGATTLGAPREELVLAGDIAEPVDNVIDYDGGIEMYTYPDPGKVQPDGGAAAFIEDSENDITDADEPEEQEAIAYYEPLEHLVLDGGAPVYEP